MSKVIKIASAMIITLAVIGLADMLGLTPDRDLQSTRYSNAEEFLAEQGTYLDEDSKPMRTQKALEVSNIRLKEVQGVYHITGKITNNSGVAINSYEEIVFYNDDTGDVERVKTIRIDLEPNESFMFDEIVGFSKPSLYVHIQ